MSSGTDFQVCTGICRGQASSHFIQVLTKLQSNNHNNFKITTINQSLQSHHQSASHGKGTSKEEAEWVSGVIVERQGQLTYLVKVKSHLYSIQIKTVQNRVVHHYFAQHSSDGNSVFYAGKTVCESCWRLVYGNTSFLPWSKHLQLESFILSAEDKDYHSFNIANYMQLID